MTHNPRELSADDSLGNLAAMHTACHSEKTSTEDRPRIDKAHRQEKLTMARVQSKRPFPKRSDPWGKERRR